MRENLHPHFSAKGEAAHMNLSAFSIKKTYTPSALQKYRDFKSMGVQHSRQLVDTIRHVKISE